MAGHRSSTASVSSQRRSKVRYIITDAKTGTLETTGERDFTEEEFNDFVVLQRMLDKKVHVIDDPKLRLVETA